MTPMQATAGPLDTIVRLYLATAMKGHSLRIQVSVCLTSPQRLQCFDCIPTVNSLLLRQPITADLFQILGCVTPSGLARSMPEAATPSASSKSLRTSSATIAARYLRSPLGHQTVVILSPPSIGALLRLSCSQRHVPLACWRCAVGSHTRKH